MYSVLWLALSVAMRMGFWMGGGLPARLGPNFESAVMACIVRAIMVVLDNARRLGSAIV